MSERIPLYERPIVSRIIFEREREVNRAIRALTGETGVPSDIWLDARNATIEAGAPPFVVDHILIKRGKIASEKRDIRETQIMAPVSGTGEKATDTKKLKTTQEAPTGGPRIIQFRNLTTPGLKGLKERLATRTTEAAAIKG